MDKIQLLKDNSIILTSAPGNGCTSMVLGILEQLCENEIILYYQPLFSIDRLFVKQFYPKVFNNVVFVSMPVVSFLDFITDTLGTFNRIIVDSADVLLTKKDRINVLIPTLIKLSNIFKFKLILTSQIRRDPSKSGDVYSTVEKLNKQLVQNRQQHIEYSMWLLNVTEPDNVFKRKYLDVYSQFRIGNKYKYRYLITFDKMWGNIIEKN